MPFKQKHHWGLKVAKKRDLGRLGASSCLSSPVKASDVVGVKEYPESILKKGGVLCSHHGVNRLLVKMQVEKYFCLRRRKL